MTDSIDLLAGLSEEDATREKPVFTKGEKVEFLIKDFKVLTDKGNAVILSCMVVSSGEHTTKDYTIYIPDASNDVRKKQRAAFFFLSGFWTPAELKDGTYKMARIMGRKFCATAGAPKPGKDGGPTFQDMYDIRDLGEAVPGAAPAAAASPGAAAPAVVAATVAGTTKF